MKLDTEVTLVFKDPEGNTVRLSTTLEDMIHRDMDSFYDELEGDCTSSSCHNESVNFCECGGLYEAYGLSDIKIHNTASNEEIKESFVGENYTPFSTTEGGLNTLKSHLLGHGFAITKI